MNRTKRNLIIWAIVLNFVSMATNVAFLIWSAVSIEGYYSILGIALTESELTLVRTQEIITYAIDVALNLAAAICLILMLKNSVVDFKVSKKFFIAGLIINVLYSPFSIASILLYIAYFAHLDIQVVKEKEDEDDVEIIDSEEQIKAKIEKLRKLKEQGIITEEEFREEIMKLL